MSTYTDYRLDAEETGACGVPCMREAGNPDAPLLKYDATLPDGRTVWGHVFRVTRIARGLTVEAAADAVGVAVSTVARWEAGSVTPAPAPARRYWQALLRATPPPETRGPRRGPRQRSAAAAGKREAGAEGSRTRPGRASGMEATAPTQRREERA